MTNRQNLIIGLVYFVFLMSFYPLDTSKDHYSVSSWMNWKFWVPTVIFFFIGLRGFRKGKSVEGTTWSGTRFTGFIDEGAIQGTNGLPGGIALSLGYVSAYVVMALISVTALKTMPNGLTGGPTLLVGVILFALIIPLYFLFLYLIRAKKLTTWIIGGAWLIFLVIAARK